MSKIELGKTYRTRDGREVRIYAVDGGKVPAGYRYAVHGAVLSEALGWEAEQWCADGKYQAGSTLASRHDLIEVRPRIKRTVWLNVYPEDAQSSTPAWFTRDLADRLRNANRIACVKVDIDVEEGHGL